VYALSAHSGRNVLERCLALGMNGCLNKPYELSELYAVLRQHYSGRGYSGLLPLLPLLPVGSKALPGQDGIPGLDPLCAINDTGISPTLYPRLLAKFRKQFAEGPQGLRIDVEARAWERVVPFAHTLKGRAGLLGMTEVASIATRLEVAANASDSARAVAALEALERCLQTIVAGLGRILPPDADAEVFP
jgi:two-component system, sensor histidine kinase and response regulator